MGSDYFLNPPPPDPTPRLYDEYKVSGHEGAIFDSYADARAFRKLLPKNWTMGKPKIMHRVVSHWREVR
jgi:hypothetical protein